MLGQTSGVSWKRQNEGECSY